MSGITVTDLQDDLNFGSRVRGVNWETLADENVREELRQLFIKRGMIVFEDMEPTGKMQVALSKVFGPLKDHPTNTTPRSDEDEASGVIDMHYKPNEEDLAKGDGLVEFDGKLVARFSPWHFDHCYNDQLNYAGVLRSPVGAPAGEGGRTGFMDGIELYQNFPKELRDKIEDKNIIYTLDTRLQKMRYGVNFRHVSGHASEEALLKEAAVFPRAMHPAVWTRETGEKVMHVGGWMADGMEHHEDAEGDALLDEICHKVNELGNGPSAYWHQWKPTDMVIWDNWRMLHAVEGCDAKYERRTIRSTIQGDYGHGYFEDGKKIGEVLREVA